MEVKYCPGPLGQNEYNKLGETLSLMLRMCRPIYGSGKAVVLESGFFFPKVLQISKPEVSMRQI